MPATLEKKPMAKQVTKFVAESGKPAVIEHESNSVLVEIPMGEALGPVITYRTLKLTHDEAVTLNSAWVGLMEQQHLVRGKEISQPIDVFYYFLEQLRKPA